MSDESIAARIERLVTEEKDLRQRRALEEFDLDPEGAEVRDPDVVERYKQ